MNIIFDPNNLIDREIQKRIQEERDYPYSWHEETVYRASCTNDSQRTSIIAIESETKEKSMRLLKWG